MRAVLFITLLASLTVIGCNGGNDKTDALEPANANSNTGVSFKTPDPVKPSRPVDPNFKSCNAHFPLIPGSLAKYTLTYATGLVADVTVVVDEAREDARTVFVETTQILDRSGGLNKIENTVRRYVCDGERVQIVSEKTDNRVDQKHDLVESKFRNVAVMMVEPSELKRKGATWSYNFNQVFSAPDRPPVSPDEPVRIVFEAQGQEDVTVPAGTFKAIKVLRKVGQNQVSDYYARGLGLIKRQSGEGARWELREYSGLKPQ